MFDFLLAFRFKTPPFYCRLVNGFDKTFPLFQMNTLDEGHLLDNFNTINFTSWCRPISNNYAVAVAPVKQGNRIHCGN